MFENHRPYSSYKDSGIPWLGKIPDHWHVRRNKLQFLEMDERAGSNEGLLLSLTRSSGLIPQSVASSRLAASDDRSNYRVCRKDDLVMNRMQAWSGMFAASDYSGVVSPDYSVFKPRTELDVRYFVNLFKTSILVTQFAINSKGIGSGFNRLYTDAFGNIPVPVPPLSEQSTIACFLNRFDSRVQHYIRTKQKLLSLLEEQKQAIIHQAVTGQIDVLTGKPYPAYKPSEVEWVGYMPEHWEVRRLSKVARILNGATPSSSELRFWYGDIIWITPEDLGKLSQKFIESSARRITSEGYAACGTQLAPPGSIAISTRAPIGHIGILTREACVNQGCRLLVPDRNLDTLFLYFQLFLNRSILESLGQGSTFMELAKRNLAAFPIALPPVLEQSAISEYLNTTSTDIETTISQTHRQIYLIETYRTRLVSDVVTGKLDVREATANFPNDTQSMDDLADKGSINEAVSQVAG